MAKKVTTLVSNTPESVASGGAGDPASTAAVAEPAPEASAVSPVEVAIAVGGELAALAPSAATLPGVHYAEVQPKATELRSFALTKPVRYQRRRYAKGEPITVDMDQWAELFVGGVLAEEWDAVTAGEA